MKPLYIETRKKFNDINLKPLNKIKAKTISLGATVQYLNLIPKIKSHLEKQGKKVIIKQGSFHKAQVLGCNSSALNKTADAILIITDGKFHAINNAIQLQKPIYIFNTKTLEKITQKELNKQNKKTLSKQKKFLSSKKIGILVSTKHGQNFKQINQIKSKIEKLDKKVYIFESNNINPNEFENFPQIQLWINTACFGLAQDDPKIINLSDITQFLK